MKPHLVYCHGFGSGPQSTSKGLALGRALGPELASMQLPDLQGPSFFDLRMDAMVGRLDSCLAQLPADGAPLLLAGSSLGAYLAAQRAARGVDRPLALLLIAPAFGFVSRWRDLLGADGVAEWRATGSRTFYHHRSGSDQELGVGFLQSCQGLPDQPPATAHPTVVIHGRHDEVVAWEAALAYTQQAAHAQFHLLDEGHSVNSEAATRLLIMLARELLDQLQGQAA